MRVFVTGATGHVGGRLVRRRRARGDGVVALVLPGRDLTHGFLSEAKARREPGYEWRSPATGMADLVAAGA